MECVILMLNNNVIYIYIYSMLLHDRIILQTQMKKIYVQNCKELSTTTI